MQELLAAIGPNAKRGIRSYISIQKAKLKDGCLTASISEKLDNENAGRELVVTCGDAAHPDLLTAFQALVPDFAMMTEQVSTISFSGGEPSEQTVADTILLSVTGITWKGFSFVLIGTRELQSGHTLNLIAPMMAFDDVSERVPKLLENLNREIELGLRGKCSDAGRQLDMFPTDQPGLTLVGAGERGPLLLGEGAEEVAYEDVTDDDGPNGNAGPPPATDSEQPKKRGRGRPRKQQPA